MANRRNFDDEETDSDDDEEYDERSKGSMVKSSVVQPFKKPEKTKWSPEEVNTFIYRILLKLIAR